MNTRETLNVVFIAAVAVVLLAAFIYVNLPGEEEEEAADSESGEDGGSEGEDAGGEESVAETQYVSAPTPVLASIQAER